MHYRRFILNKLIKYLSLSLLFIKMKKPLLTLSLLAIVDNVKAQEITLDKILQNNKSKKSR